MQPDGNLYKSSVLSQFPGATGLRFKGRSRPVEHRCGLTTERFIPPDGGGWSTSQVYTVVVPTLVDHF